MDRGDTLFLAELLIFSGLALAWGFWELWTLNREQKKDREKASTPTGEDGPSR